MRVADRPEFAEIPAHVKDLVDPKIRARAFGMLGGFGAQAFEHLLQARGDLGPPPKTYFNRLPGRLVMIFFAILFGVLVGSLAVVIVLYSIRNLATVL
jgi:hypothetical protein